MQGKKLLIGITGSIAAYKTILLVRLLVKAGASIKVVMTPAAKDFVSPLVLETLSQQKVVISIAEEGTWANHVMLGRWADVFLIAPASCNTIAKMATGICDNLLLAVYLSATCPVMVAPAMDEDMWKHPATQRNVQLLQSYGVAVLGVGSGDLASGLVGPGRMLEPEALVDALHQHFTKLYDLKGLNAIVTAGPTYESIDPVRFIGNHSTGLMGIEIANALASRGAQTTLVLGPSHLKPNEGVEVVPVTSASQMYEAVVQGFANADIAVMAAAVADYRPASAAIEKIKKSEDALTLHLVKNPDILHHCGWHKRSNQLVVGFALETTNESQNATEKLWKKKADMMVLNSLRDENAGFGTVTNKISIFESNGNTIDVPFDTKQNLAKKIAALVAQRIHEKNTP